MSDPVFDSCDQFIQQQGIDTGVEGWRTKLPQPPQFPFEQGKTYVWKLETNQGPIHIRLMPEVAPMHSSSTVFLARTGFYDGLRFHRVIDGFMAQGGCPLGTGTGGPGYQYDGEFDPKVRHNKAGLLSMANAGPGTDGSQFFITFVPTPHLDDKHTIFGEVTEGMETVQALEAKGTPRGATTEPLLIERTTIEVA